MSKLEKNQTEDLNEDEYDRILQVNVFLNSEGDREGSPCYKYTIKDNIYGGVQNGHRLDDNDILTRHEISKIKNFLRKVKNTEDDEPYYGKE